MTSGLMASVRAYGLTFMVAVSEYPPGIYESVVF